MSNFSLIYDEKCKRETNLIVLDDKIKDKNIMNVFNF